MFRVDKGLITYTLSVNLSKKLWIYGSPRYFIYVFHLSGATGTVAEYT